VAFFSALQEKVAGSTIAKRMGRSSFFILVDLKIVDFVAD
jgi:hypothetical protein